ncbi:hypothetical protein E4U38_006438 [Claviceps purpurea]|nr:hypothetical protein E4U38_006438 [Claviceps purpurea]KAG6296816.1 hypothetical protein E4U46_001394 [Claviceps purpurea]
MGCRQLAANASSELQWPRARTASRTNEIPCDQTRRRREVTQRQMRPGEGERPPRTTPTPQPATPAKLCAAATGAP